ncbi:apolipoprotein N-acyltransferase [Thermocrinis albus DSM 14484]|uniref:Apolipoprotein N-acyltransferase n=1 Tax=Thermocrinis albus (strain DSM 14484 / JCM 11386 / HI 11/12) TaxID=638303 RepID=D3SMF7_THEAH|nr:apolipoprotein N-acyltransferase [Thermocrinis albus]ADC89937.1 apolipoprotein N-acyltransferase [Thermocrinis albus DSM 14484]
MRDFFKGLLVGFCLYLPFSHMAVWYFSLLGLYILLKDINVRFWTISGFVFFLLSLKCATIAVTQYGGISWPLAYALVVPFVLFLTLFQFTLPVYLTKKSHVLLLPIFYLFAELIRSYHPYGGFPWLIVGTLTVYFPFLKHSLSLFNVYFQSFFLLMFLTLLARRRWMWMTLLLSVWVLSAFYGYTQLEKKMTSAKEILVALVQTAVPQQDKLRKDLFYQHTDSILDLLQQAVSKKPDLTVLPESALPFFFSEEDMMEPLYRMSYLSPILVGLVDIREGTKPYNSAYLLANGRLVDHYDKVKLMPIGEFLPEPFGFLKRLFPAISGIDYVPGDQIRPLRLGDIRIATPICFEIAHMSLVHKMADGAHLVAVLTNDGWFNNSDCSYQHLLWAKVRALELGKYVLWVNNSGDTGAIAPDGSIVKRLGYMHRGFIYVRVKLLANRP